MSEDVLDVKLKREANQDGMPWGRLVFWLIICGMCAYGVFFIYSTGYIGDEYPVRPNWLRQLIWLAVGMTLGVLVGQANPRGLAWRAFVWGGYGTSVLLLLLVLLAGCSIGGARRWLVIGPLMIQPAEFAKFFTLMAFCELLNWRSSGIRRWLARLAGLLVIAAVPLGLIVMAPSVGNAFSIVPSLLCVLGVHFVERHLWSGMVWLCALLLIGACVSVINLRQHGAESNASDKQHAEARGFFKAYHLGRFKSYLTPQGGWNERQSIMTLASGGRYGKGYLQGTMKSLGYLPRTVAPTDFIFSVIGEELGFFYGCLPVLLLYMVLFSIGFHWTGHALDEGARLRGVAVLMLLATHVLINVGMTVRLVPVIGLPLPLLSYGGSFTVATCLCLGVLQNTSYMTSKDIMAAKLANDNEWSLWRLVSIKLKIKN